MLSLTLKDGGFVRIGESVVYVSLNGDGRIKVDVDAPPIISIERDQLLIDRLEKRGYEIWRENGHWTVTHPDFPGKETTPGGLIQGGKP